MGTSGSGKTSFLNLLAGRYSVGDVKGKVLCNGTVRSTAFKRSIG
jgi:ABC-type multidrug transport system ATPase subunit